MVIFKNILVHWKYFHLRASSKGWPSLYWFFLQSNSNKHLGFFLSLLFTLFWLISVILAGYEVPFGTINFNFNLLPCTAIVPQVQSLSWVDSLTLRHFYSVGLMRSAVISNTAVHLDIFLIDDLLKEWRLGRLAGAEAECLVVVDSLRPRTENVSQRSASHAALVSSYVSPIPAYVSISVSLSCLT